MLKRKAPSQLTKAHVGQKSKRARIGSESSTKAAATGPLVLRPLRQKIQYKRISELIFSVSPLNVTGSTTLNQCGVIAEGTSDTTRDGGMVRYEFLEWKFTCGRLVASTTATVRLVIYRWKQGLATTTVQDILEDATATSNVHGTYSVQWANKYKILHDQIYNLGDPIFQAAGQFGTSNKTFGGKIKLGYNVQYDNNLGNSGDDTIYAFACADFANNAFGTLTTALTYTEV